MLRLMCQSHLEFVGESSTVVINTLLRRRCKRTPPVHTLAWESTTLFIFLLRLRALPLVRFGNCCLLCAEECGFMSIALNCIGRVYVDLCVTPRLGASVTVWGINLLGSASFSFFHYQGSLTSRRKRWRKMRFTQCLLTTHIEHEGWQKWEVTHGCTVS